MNLVATIGNLAFERGDEESIPEFRQRARDAAAELGGGVLTWGSPEALEWIDSAPEVITITGGLEPDASENFATLIERGDGELIEAFRARARARAFGLGKSIVFGGLRPMPADDSSNEI